MLTLVLGGARSGKSHYAQSLCPEGAIYIATAIVGDDIEMQRRVARHRQERPAGWETIQEGELVPEAVRDSNPRHVPVIVDCITVWIANLLDKYKDLAVEHREETILAAVDLLAAVAKSRTVIAVSNEVGNGVVPENSIAREFRDIHGLANQHLARAAARVVFLIAGIPLDVSFKRKG